MDGPGDAHVEQREDPTIIQPADAPSTGARCST